MRRWLLFFLLGLSVRANAQSKDNHIVIGTVDSIYSSVLKETRKIWIHLPNSEGGYDPQKKYPVIYLLDGDVFFYPATGIAQFLSQNGICPEVILVGIPSTDRLRDLTPWHDATVPADSDMMSTSGGGELFTSFLEKELIPYIGSHYPVAPYRMLVGHSLGGLLALNTLINHTSMFNSYVAIDPAIYWAGQCLLKQAKTVLAQKKFNNTSLYMGLSGALPNADSIMKDKTLATLYDRSVLEFDRLVCSSPDHGLHYRKKYYDDETHNTVGFPAIYDALHFIFDFVPLPHIQKDTVTTAFYTNHYRRVSEKMGYMQLPPEEIINGMGYYFLRKKRLDKAYDFFQMNISNYPGSYNVYDSMSDLYAAKGNNEKAIKYLKKELTLKDLPYIRQKLEALNKQK